MFDTGAMRAGVPHEADAFTESRPKADHLTLVGGGVTTAAVLARERTLPVAPSLRGLMPGGALQRGSNLAVHGVGATSFALAAAGECVRQGSFLAVVAPSSFGLGACVDFGIPLRRVVQFSVVDDALWGPVVASLIDGFDMVLIADRRRVGTRQARQLVARNRERGSVLMQVGGPSWPDAVDLRFDVVQPRWTGLGQGHGHLRSRQVAVQVAGRRHRGAPKVHELLLPAADGGVAAPPRVEAEMPQSVDQRSTGERSTTQRSTGERFAGSDIDALLDAADASHTGDEFGEPEQQSGVA